MFKTTKILIVILMVLAVISEIFFIIILQSTFPLLVYLAENVQLGIAISSPGTAQMFSFIFLISLVAFTIVIGVAIYQLLDRYEYLRSRKE
jgi:hypothetical protein